MFHSLNVKSLFIRGCVERFSKPTVFSSAKCMWSSSGNIVRSSYPDIEISKLSLSNYLLENVKDYVDKPAVTCGASGRTYNYGEVQFMTDRLAKAFRAIRACNLRKNDTLGILLPNMPEFTPVVLGANKAGLKITFANPLYTPEEILRQFEVAKVKIMVTIPSLLPVSNFLKAKMEGYRGTICIGGKDDLDNNVFNFESLIKTDHIADLPTISPKDIAIIPFSSGTSGLPKGVLLTNENCVANLCQITSPPFNRYAHEECENKNVLSIPPFFHIYGFNGILNLTLRNGAHLISLPKFSPEDYIRSLVTYEPSVLFLVPSLMLFLASHPSVTKKMLEPVAEVLVGAAAATVQLQEKFRSKCVENIVIRQGYGMTEASPVTLLTPFKPDESKLGSTGQLLPNMEARIVSTEDGTVLGMNETGELQFRGPQVMKGYLNNEAATKDTLDEDGWLKTGDIGYYDSDYYFYIVDRCKELIKVKGNQVSPTELENIIAEIDGIADVAVVGIPDDLAGELPRAYVVLKHNSKLNKHDIISYIQQKCIKYKWLEGGVKIVKAIPRNHSGKILRNELRSLDQKGDK
ncbi:4-coumarate--CoA ligase 1 [Pseudolycoriella hygida]|uniref:4-coumarate--CoA ligase 1 n=1 Tax=Pseudolycoriella hygida TaxID=35572 RepID=A0A9Q0RV72_9DIPT|nr:4-coumarate--CoA ligase 1 [Pseudolycoriella hygida]